MKVIILGGEPATGKTTIMKNLIRRKKLKSLEHKLLRGSIDKKSKLILLGIYDKGIDEDSFCGTDRLSMSVQPDAIAFVEKASKKYTDYTLLLEGDRLFNQKFLDSIKGYGLAISIIVLGVSKKELHKRHKHREGDTQTDKFLKGRKTKVNNIVINNDVVLMKHEKSKDTKAIVGFINSLIEAKIEKFTKIVSKSVVDGGAKRVFCGVESKTKFW